MEIFSSKMYLFITEFIPKWNNSVGEEERAILRDVYVLLQSEVMYEGSRSVLAPKYVWAEGEFMKDFVSYGEILFDSPVFKGVEFEGSEALLIGGLFEARAEVYHASEVFLYTFYEEGICFGLGGPYLSAVFQFGADICSVCLE